MKNKFVLAIILILLSLNLPKLAVAEDFIFEISALEISDNGNIFKGKSRGKIIDNSQLEILSDNFEYLKKKNQLKVNGNVNLYDLKNNITINAETIFYFKDEEKISTVGKTLIKISDKYTIEGYDLILLKNDMILYSNKGVIIKDKKLSEYKLDNFEYSINQEILKGENIQVSINGKNKNDGDEFFIKEGFFNLKNNKFLAKDIVANLHKNLFGNNKNDPRIIAVSGEGDGLITSFKKGVFTSCKKTDKCPPWKMTTEKMRHDKIKKQIIYKNAWLELYDFPVAYFPKFFHPDPTVKRQSGLLRPGIGDHDSLGDSLYLPYFFVISDEKDFTLKPRLFNDNKLVLQTEYRQETKNSLTVIDSSITKGHYSDKENKNDKDTRSHLFINTKIDLNFKDQF